MKENFYLWIFDPDAVALACDFGSKLELGINKGASAFDVAKHKRS